MTSVEINVSVRSSIKSDRNIAIQECRIPGSLTKGFLASIWLRTMFRRNTKPRYAWFHIYGKWNEILNKEGNFRLDHITYICLYQNHEKLISCKVDIITWYLVNLSHQPWRIQTLLDSHNITRVLLTRICTSHHHITSYWGKSQIDILCWHVQGIYQRLMQRKEIGIGNILILNYYVEDIDF